MPIVTVKIAKGRPIKTKRKLVKELTDIIVKNLDVQQEIEEFDRENWSTGGTLHSDKFGKGFGKKKSKN